MDSWVPSFSYAKKPFAYRMPRQTVRDHHQTVTVQNNVEGRAVRLLLSNAGNPTAVDFDHFTISAAGIETEYPVTLEGETVIHLEACEERWSDEVPLAAQAGIPFVVKTQVTGPFGLTDTVLHSCPAYCRVERQGQLKYPPLGKKPLQALYGTDTCMWMYGFRAIEVNTNTAPKVLAAFGDSITHMSLWTGPLAARLGAEFPGGASLLNRGINGNRLLRDSSQYAIVQGLFGEAGVRRFERTIYEHGRVDAVLVLEGVNDLCHPVERKKPDEMPTAQDLIAGLDKISQVAHRRGTKAYGCTILPFGGYKAWSPALEQIRLEVNHWIMTSRAFDGTFDLAAMVCDAHDPSRMDKHYDSGDGLHPNGAGGAKIAESINLKQLMEEVKQGGIS